MEDTDKRKYKERARYALDECDGFLLFTFKGDKAMCACIGKPYELAAAISIGILDERADDVRTVMMGALLGSLEAASKKSKED